MGGVRNSRMGQAAYFKFTNQNINGVRIMKEKDTALDVPQTKVTYYGRKIYVASPQIVSARVPEQKQPHYEDEVLLQKTDCPKKLSR